MFDSPRAYLDFLGKGSYRQVLVFLGGPFFYFSRSSWKSYFTDYLFYFGCIITHGNQGADLVDAFKAFTGEYRGRITCTAVRN